MIWKARMQNGPPCVVVLVCMMFFDLRHGILAFNGIQSYRSSSRLREGTNHVTPSRFSFSSTHLKIATDDSSTTTSTSESSTFTTMEGISFTPMFDFGSPNKTVAQQSIESFDRIDDVIMGGISSSTLQLVEEALAASWSGVVRIDGGGFCGFRTLPFVTPYNATGQDGIYLRLRLESDNEPHRRVWKVTLRTDTSRGELVYQAQISIPPTKPLPILPSSLTPSSSQEDATTSASSSSDSPKVFHTVLVPFKEFKQVRGPRMVLDGPPLDVSGGLYQVGMTCSKFQMAANTTQLENFRPGYFNLLIRDIGLYRESSIREDYEVAFQQVGQTNAAIKAMVPQTMTKEESKKNVPLILKILRPISVLFFTEKGNRRKSAMNLLRNKRKMTRWSAFWWGVRYRSRAMGMLQGGIIKTLSILAIDSLRFVLGSFIRYGVFLPLRVVGRITKMFRSSSKQKEPQSE